MNYRIFIADDDSKLQIYLGSQVDEPPSEFQMATVYRPVDGSELRTKHQRTYRRILMHKHDCVYSEIVPAGV